MLQGWRPQPTCKMSALPLLVSSTTSSADVRSCAVLLLSWPRALVYACLAVAWQAEVGLSLCLGGRFVLKEVRSEFRESLLQTAEDAHDIMFKRSKQTAPPSAPASASQEVVQPPRKRVSEGEQCTPKEPKKKIHGNQKCFRQVRAHLFCDMVLHPACTGVVRLST